MKLDKIKNINIKNFSILTDSKAMSALVIFVIFALTFFYIYPSSLEVKRLTNEINSAKSDLVHKQTSQYQLPDVIAGYQKYEPKIELLNKAILNKNRELEFITLLEAIAEKNDLEQKISINEYQEADNKNYSKMPIQIIAAGNFINQIKYLQDLEQLPNYVNIKKFNIGKATEAQKNNIFIFADTYWQ